MKQGKWPLIWLVQFAVMLGFGMLAALAEWLGKIPYDIAAWALMPVAGMLTACRATRRGLLNYAAWIAPPVCMWLSYRICWSYSPQPGPVLVCALVSLVGAAAGEVLRLQDAKK